MTNKIEYSIFLNADQQLIQKLQKIEGVEIFSLPQAVRKHLNELPNIQQKLDKGQILDTEDIHTIIELELSNLAPNIEHLIFIDYPKTLALAQDLLQYTRLKNWTLNNCIYFKASAAQKKAMKKRWAELHSTEEDIQQFSRKLEKQNRTYQQILSLLPFNKAQELILDQNPLQLFQKVVRICNLT